MIVRTYSKANEVINVLRLQAKKKHNINESDLASICECSASTLSHKASDNNLPTLSFWAVLKMAELCGKAVKIEDIEV